METKYYSCNDRSDIDNAIKFEGNYYSDFDVAIDVVGRLDLNEPLEPSGFDEDGLPVFPEATREPQWSEFLFNVIFLNDKKKDLFNGFKEEFPKTPFRVFYK